MKKFFDKTKSKFDSFSNGGGHGGQHKQQTLVANGPDQQNRINQPTQADIYRYRYQHSTNLGSVYVLEKWLTGSMFPYADGQQSSELEAVKSFVGKEGIDSAKNKWRGLWQNAVSDQDLDWLVNEGKATSIRLPIGYFTLGPAYCGGTPFEPFGVVYEEAWSSVCTLVDRLKSRNIGTLIDFHALPGGANGGEHSGTNSGRAELWGNRSNIDLSLRCIGFLAQECSRMEGVVGLQLCNEAEYNAQGLYQFYDQALNTIQGIDPTLPVYISDAWDLNKCIGYTMAKNSVPQGNPVMIDTHHYWCFSDADKGKSTQQIIQEVGTKMGELDGKEGSVVDKGAVNVVVGEYSCVLDDQTWDKSGGKNDDLVRQFGQAQSSKYQQRAAGAFFWTWKMDWMPGGEWGFVQQTPNVPAPSPSFLSQQDVQSKAQQADSQREGMFRAAVDGHVNYWNQTSPNQQFEHWRYETGWNAGFSDARAFFAGGQGRDGGDKIGALELWVRKRIVESGMGGGYVWEFEQGIRKGVQDFYQAAGV